MKHLSKEEILQRGWTEEKIDFFLHIANNKNQKIDEKAVIKRENYISFKNFLSIKEFLERKESFENQFNLINKKGLELASSAILSSHKNLLLDKKENLDTTNDILIINRENIENGNTYTAFTDGSFKSIGKMSVATCAGWIINNEKNKVVLEFIKIVDLNKKRFKGMPDFELMGIYETSKLISNLNIKNVSIYSDCLGEAKMILEAMFNIGTNKIDENKQIYTEILTILKNTNSNIGWIPREYNQYADELNKVLINKKFNRYKKEVIDFNYFEEKGYLIDRTKEIYFNNNNFKYVNFNKLTNNVSILFNRVENKKNIVLSYDHKDDFFQIIKEVKNDFSYIDDSLPNKVKHKKKSRLDINGIANIINSTNIKNINICVTDKTMAVLKKLKPIEPDLQEEFFALHKSINDFNGDICFTELPKMLKLKADEFIEKNTVRKTLKIKK